MSLQEYFALDQPDSEDDDDAQWFPVEYINGSTGDLEWCDTRNDSVLLRGTLFDGPADRPQFKLPDWFVVEDAPFTIRWAHMTMTVYADRSVKVNPC